jgi:hypothetical protein
VKKYPQKDIDSFCRSIVKKVPDTKYQDGRIFYVIKPCGHAGYFGGYQLFHMDQLHKGSAYAWICVQLKSHKKICKGCR